MKELSKNLNPVSLKPGTKQAEIPKEYARCGRPNGLLYFSREESIIFYS
jgi:hypothetical protein